MTITIEIQTSTDWGWYKLSLDVNAKYSHLHFGIPAEVPFWVQSEKHYDPDGTDFYQHTFIYQEKIKCKSCGNVHRRWPEIYPEDFDVF